MTTQTRKAPAASFRLPGGTLKQVEELAERFGSSKTTVLSIAIDRMYQQEIAMSKHTFEDLQSVLRRIPAGEPFSPYAADTVTVIKNDDGSIAVMDNGEETTYVSIADAVEDIEKLRNDPLDLSTVSDYI